MPIKKKWSNDDVNLVPTKRYHHKGYSCDISNSSTHYSKVISKVKVFKKWVKLQGQGDWVKHNGTHGKVSSQGILM